MQLGVSHPRRYVIGAYMSDTLFIPSNILYLCTFFNRHFWQTSQNATVFCLMWLRRIYDGNFYAPFINALTYFLTFHFGEDRQSRDFDDKNDIISATSSSFASGFRVTRH